MASFNGLRPFAKYQVMVKARTEVGYGPSVTIEQQTPTAGKHLNKL